MTNRLWVDLRINGFNPDSVPESEKHHGIVMVSEADAAAQARKTFPILKGDGAKIDYQLVADHAEQARANHYQTVARLAERGGLSWCELYAVLHNRKWEKIETNEAMIACRALEARYLAALAPDLDAAEVATWPQHMQDNFRRISGQREAMKALTVRQAPYALPAHEDRPDGFRCLAFHRGKWRDVCWSVDHQRFSLGYGGAFILEGDRQFAQLPPIPADDAWGFYGDRS